MDSSFAEFWMAPPKVHSRAAYGFAGLGFSRRVFKHGQHHPPVLLLPPGSGRMFAFGRRGSSVISQTGGTLMVGPNSRFGGHVVHASSKFMLHQNQAWCGLAAVHVFRTGLTPHSSRTQPALPGSTSLGVESSSSLKVWPQAGPLNFFR